MSARRPLACLVIALLVLLGAGCDQWRSYKPPQSHTIEVLGGGDYTFNGQLMTLDGVERQLQALADANRHPTTGVAHKVHIHIQAEKGSANAQARHIGSYCNRVGLSIVMYETR